MSMLGLNQHRTSEVNTDGTNARRRTGTNVLKRNPDGCIHSFSSEQGKSISQIVNAFATEVVRDVRCKRKWIRHQTSRMAFIDENAKILKY